jgi:hypothetical protein
VIFPDDVCDDCGSSTQTCACKCYDCGEPHDYCLCDDASCPNDFSVLCDDDPEDLPCYGIDFDGYGDDGGYVAFKAKQHCMSVAKLAFSSFILN